VSIEWREDAPANLIKLAIGRRMIASMDHGKWLELGLLTNTQTQARNRGFVTAPSRDHQALFVHIAPSLQSLKSWASRQIAIGGACKRHASRIAVWKVTTTLVGHSGP
jgi:hypothetical protein